MHWHLTRAACHKAAMFTAYDSVFALSSSQGVALHWWRATRWSDVTATSPSQRTAATQSGRGSAITSRKLSALSRSPDRGCRSKRSALSSTVITVHRHAVTSIACLQRNRTGSGRSTNCTDWLSHCRCGSTKQAFPSQASSVSKTPSLRTAARS